MQGAVFGGDIVQQCLPGLSQPTQLLKTLLGALSQMTTELRYRLQLLGETGEGWQLWGEVLQSVGGARAMGSAKTGKTELLKALLSCTVY